MVSSTGVEAAALITDVRLSTVVPARMTPENAVHELTPMDLAMKLHYLKGLYFFNSDAVQGISISDLKEPMFLLLDTYCHVAGRIRRPEDGGRRVPVIKCNDSGVRIVEARSNKTVDEWLGVNDCGTLDEYLIYNHVLGPDLGFSPLVFIQFTWFKCGGLSVGLSWAHILGDAFSASHFISLWAQIIAGNDMPTQPPIPTKVKKFQFPSLIPDKPFSLKRVDPVGDYWLSTNNYKMETQSFHVTAKQLNHLLSNTSSNIVQPIFQALSAIIWKSLAKIRGESEPKIVTICTRNSKEMRNGTLDNGQLISTVQADFSVAKADTMKLLKLIAEKSVDDRGMIEELVEGDNENSDLLVYGANLTLVNLEEADIYNVELKGSKPIFANYSMMGVGDEGVILILPGPENGARLITMVLPEGEGMELKNQLKKGCGLF